MQRIQVGDQVLIKQQRENKLSSKFESEPYEVIKRTGNEVMLKASHGGTYRRNVAHVKSFQSNGNFKFDDAMPSEMRILRNVPTLKKLMMLLLLMWTLVETRIQ